nr:putative SAWADEE domain-containing protein [Tanacetum cinerariifolium]
MPLPPYPSCQNGVILLDGVATRIYSQKWKRKRIYVLSNVPNKLKRDDVPRKTRSLTIAEEAVVGSKASRLESLRQKKQPVAEEGSSAAHDKYYSSSDTTSDATLYSSSSDKPKRSANETDDADKSDMNLSDDNPHRNNDAARPHTYKNTQTHSCMSSTTTNATMTPPFELDYKSIKDDAYYTSGVILEDNNRRLRVKLQDFLDSKFDEVFTVNDFKNIDDVSKFLRRFRPVSVAVEDNECAKVTENMTVCASYHGDDDSLRYFDAIVDTVHYKEHTPEKCICNYVLHWQHGPAVDNLTAA